MAPELLRVGVGPRYGDVPPGFIGETLLLGQERGHEAHIDVRALQPAALDGRAAASLEVGHQLGEERLGELVPSMMNRQPRLRALCLIRA